MSGRAAATSAAWKTAIDLHIDAPGADSLAPRQAAIGVLRPALWVLGCALGIHVVASIGQWGWLYWQSSQVQREIAALAQSAAPEEIAAGGLSAVDEATLRFAIGKYYDEPTIYRAAAAFEGAGDWTKM